MRLESDSARAFYVQRRDIEKFGRTGTCPGCDAIARGSKRAVAHSTACRERIFDLVEKEDESRILRYFDRVRISESNRKRKSEAADEIRVDEVDETKDLPPIPEDEDIFADWLDDEAGSPKRASESQEASQSKRSKSVLPSRRQKRKAEEQPEAENLRGDAGESSSSGGAAVEVGGGPSRSPIIVEDVGAATESQSAPSVGAVSDELVREMNGLKGCLASLEESHVEMCFRKQGVEIIQEEVKQIAAMSVEIGCSPVVEVFSPKRFTAEASKLGLRPGFAVDLSETKPYGANQGHYWDLALDGDVAELMEMLQFEDPYLCTGSPPCDPFSILQNISSRFVDAEVRRCRLDLGRKHLHTAVGCYRSQMQRVDIFFMNIRLAVLHGIILKFNVCRRNLESIQSVVLCVSEI